MKVLVKSLKSLKNEPTQHDLSSKTTENVCITCKCEHALISLNLYYIIIFVAAHFVVKGNINDVLYQKLLPLEPHAASMQVTTRPLAR